MDMLNVVILAAGKGTRMNSDKPKVLHTLAGKPMLTHVLDRARMLNPTKVCVVYGHGGEAVPAALQNTDVLCVKQEPQLGTGHAVQQAMPNLGEGLTLVLYGDVPLIQSETLEKMLTAGEGLTLLTVTLLNPTGYGRIVRNRQGEILRIVEEKDASDTIKQIKEVNTGILLAPSKQLRGWIDKLRSDNVQGEYYLTDIVSMAVEEGGGVHSVQPENEWEIHGINSKSQLATLERIWQRVEAERLLTQGVTLADPARIDIRGSLQCGRDVEIDVGCIFEGKVLLGDHVRVGAYCIIKDANISRGTQIAPYSHIDSSEVGENCHLGPYARLRPGTKLHEAVHVGNFVEIKNSEIQQSSKANHLSYIGDTDIGRRVNIGAGTITCNYDGVNKHRTVIEDDVFIGSDTQLVAPVTIEKGSTIGAGSTITRNTPVNELTLSRSKQLTIKGWQRPVKQVK
ncbi:MAG: bifunctional UDP-N-acetylglucosamine diphosphorylase/glucosamine-1-phosphate N-acetyltransferase GlmU [Gallionella sp.]